MYGVSECAQCGQGKEGYIQLFFFRSIIIIINHFSLLLSCFGHLQPAMVASQLAVRVWKNEGKGKCSERKMKGRKGNGMDN